MNSEEGHFYQNITRPEEILPEKSLSTGPTNEDIQNMAISLGPSVVPGSATKISAQTVKIEGDMLLNWLTRYPVENNHPRSLTGAITVVRSGEVMVLEMNTKVAEAFKRLIVEGFSSSPVIDSNRRYVGFIDLLDLTWFTVKNFNAWRSEQNLGSGAAEASAHWSSYMLTDAFKNVTVADVMARPAWERRTIFNPVYKGFSTLYAMEFMSRTGAHRVPQLNKFHKVVNILTQSMIISLFDQNLNRFGDIKQFKVSSMIPMLVQGLIVVQDSDLALNAFNKMVDKNISGLAVVNDSGVLVDTISIRDLRGIGTQADKYERLWLSVASFKEAVRREFKQQTPNKPITVDANNTFEDVIKAMDDGNIHRVFVVEKNSKGESLPSHVISQRDVIRVLLWRLGLEPATVQEAD